MKISRDHWWQKNNYKARKTGESGGGVPLLLGRAHPGLAVLSTRGKLLFSAPTSPLLYQPTVLDQDFRLDGKTIRCQILSGGISSDTGCIVMLLFSEPEKAILSEDFHTKAHLD